MKYCVDFDDLCDAVVTESLEVLSQIKVNSPEFKVTLFTIPMRISDENIARVKEVGDGWIQLAPHGWRHTRGECLAWTSEEAKDKMELAAKRGIDAPVFRAPAWLLDGEVYVAAQELDYVVASHREFRIPNTKVPEYIYNQRGRRRVRAIHGHLTPCMDNFILTLKEQGRLNFPKDAEFVYPQDLACVY